MVSRLLHWFYLNVNSDYNFTHIGNLPRTDGNANLGINDVPTYSSQMISKLFENHWPAAIDQLYFESSGGRKFLQKSMTKIREIVLLRKYE